MGAPSLSCTFGPLVQSPVLLASPLLQSDHVVEVRCCGSRVGVDRGQTKFVRGWEVQLFHD